MDEREIRRAIDRIEILDLLGRYCLSLDAHDVEGWVECFTENGAFGDGERAVVGRKNLRAYAEVHTRIGARHVTCSPVHDVADDGLTATGTASTLVTVATPRGFRVIMTGGYRDWLEKVDGRWLIARRWVEFQRLPDDPDRDIPSHDPDVAAMHRTLMDAFSRLSQAV